MDEPIHNASGGLVKFPVVNRVARRLRLDEIVNDVGVVRPANSNVNGTPRILTKEETDDIYKLDQKKAK